MKPSNHVVIVKQAKDAASKLGAWLATSFKSHKDDEVTIKRTAIGYVNRLPLNDVKFETELEKIYVEAARESLRKALAGKAQNPATRGGGVSKLAKTGRAGNPHYTLSYNATLYLSPTLKGATTRVSGSDNWPVEILESSGPKKARRALIKVDVGGKHAYGWVDYDQLIGRRGNPEGDSTAAADMYETFHGKPSTGSVDYEEQHEVPDAYAELGALVEIWVLPMHARGGKSVKLTAPDIDGNLSDVVMLACNPEGNQLYFIGGDQELDVLALGFSESELRAHMTIGVITELTYQTKKQFHKFVPTNYFHKLGEDTGVEPFLTYDPHSCKMGVSGGDYAVRAEGIVN